MHKFLIIVSAVITCMRLCLLVSRLFRNNFEDKMPCSNRILLLSVSSDIFRWNLLWCWHILCLLLAFLHLFFLLRLQSAMVNNIHQMCALFNVNEQLNIAELTCVSFDRISSYISDCNIVAFNWNFKSFFPEFRFNENNFNGFYLNRSPKWTLQNNRQP